MFNPIKYEGNLGEQYSYLIKDLYELCNNEEIKCVCPIKFLFRKN